MENNGSEKNKKIKIKGLDHLSVAVPDLEKAIAVSYTHLTLPTKA